MSTPDRQAARVRRRRCCTPRAARRDADAPLRRHRRDRRQLRCTQPARRGNTPGRGRVLPGDRHSARASPGIQRPHQPRVSAPRDPTRPTPPGNPLPPDTTTVQRWNGYCVILKSRWLGREIGLPYLWTWVSQPEQTAVIQASTAPACRGRASTPTTRRHSRSGRSVGHGQTASSLGLSTNSPATNQRLPSRTACGRTGSARFPDPDSRSVAEEPGLPRGQDWAVALHPSVRRAE